MKASNTSYDRLERIIKNLDGNSRAPCSQIKMTSYREATVNEICLIRIYEMLYHLTINPSVHGSPKSSLNIDRTNSSWSVDYEEKLLSQDLCGLLWCEKNYKKFILQLGGFFISPKLASYTDWTAFTYNERFVILRRIYEILYV
jgi:hypothetical protein